MILYDWEGLREGIILIFDKHNIMSAINKMKYSTQRDERVEELEREVMDL